MTLTLVALHFMGMGEPTWLIRPSDRKIVARSIPRSVGCLKAVREEMKLGNRNETFPPDRPMWLVVSRLREVRFEIWPLC